MMHSLVQCLSMIICRQVIQLEDTFNADALPGYMMSLAMLHLFSDLMSLSVLHQSFVCKAFSKLTSPDHTSGCFLQIAGAAEAVQQ